MANVELLSEYKKMIKHFCDVCGWEIKSERIAGEAPLSVPIVTKAGVSAVTIVANFAGDLCLRCLIDAIHAKDIGTGDNLIKAIDELSLSVRTINCLHSNSIRFVRDLVRLTEVELIRIPNLGKKSTTEIKEALSNLGLSVGMRVERIEG